MTTSALPAVTEAEQRAERAAWLCDLPTAYMGDMEPMQLLREARACFVEGHFMAVILSAAAHVEHTLIDELQARGIVAPDASPSFFDAIEKAGSSSFFNDRSVLDQMHALRLVRNPLTHRKPADHKHTIGNRFRAERRHPALILEEDARLALNVMHGLFFATLRPFDMTADSEQDMGGNRVGRVEIERQDPPDR